MKESLYELLCDEWFNASYIVFENAFLTFGLIDFFVLNMDLRAFYLIVSLLYGIIYLIAKRKFGITYILCY